MNTTRVSGTMTSAALRRDRLSRGGPPVRGQVDGRFDVARGHARGRHPHQLFAVQRHERVRCRLVREGRRHGALVALPPLAHVAVAPLQVDVLRVALHELSEEPLRVLVADEAQGARARGVEAVKQVVRQQDVRCRAALEHRAAAPAEDAVSREERESVGHGLDRLVQTVRETCDARVLRVCKRLRAERVQRLHRRKQRVRERSEPCVRLACRIGVQEPGGRGVAVVRRRVPHLVHQVPRGVPGREQRLHLDVTEAQHGAVVDEHVARRGAVLLRANELDAVGQHRAQLVVAARVVPVLVRRQHEFDFVPERLHCF
mmetsp:Transcript_24296/g.75240  ORF Transcript_24296/g.75240 Transcript_24296/m.75240 type:complete len:316 (-) Transcript_24296:464-1411(-)